jgi:membrane protease YdiL (CAAX protease family)
LLGLVLRVWPPRAALIFVSTVFAAVHFLQAPPELVIRDGIQAGTGFWLVGKILTVFGNANFLLAECATLWLAGWVLGAARLRTRSLWLPIGLHAGWIFGIGMYAGLTRASRAVRRDEYLPWIGETLKSGLVPLAVLALTGAVLWIYVQRGRPSPQGTAPSSLP